MVSEDNSIKSFRSLEEIRQRKYVLRRQIDHDTQVIDKLWTSLTTRREDSTKGEIISSIISNSAIAIDAFLMVRKLRKNHEGIFRGLFKFFSSSSRKK